MNEAPPTHCVPLLLLVCACVAAGWLELDLIMGTWADENLHKLSPKELEQVRDSRHKASAVAADPIPSAHLSLKPHSCLLV